MFHVFQIHFFRNISDEARHLFTGGFVAWCQDSYVSSSLKTLVPMVISGANVDNVKNPYFKQQALTVSQLMMFNSMIKTHITSSQAFHTIKRVSPKAVYLGQLLHSKTRKLDMVHKMSHLGLSISPDRLFDISAKMGNKAIAVFEQEGVVYPLNIRHAVFTTAATDNLDMNPSSATATSAIHGMTTSLNQYIFGDNFGRSRNIPDALRSAKALKNLPEKVTNVKPGCLPPKVPTCKINSGGKEKCK